MLKLLSKKLLKNNFFIFSILFGSSLIAGDLARIEALDANANQVFSSFQGAIKPIIHLLLALIPGVVAVWMLKNILFEIRKYYHNSTNIVGIIQAPSPIMEIVISLFLKATFAFLSLFLTYGMFVTIYADPNGNMSYQDAWGMLVVDFWREAIHD